MKTFWRAEKGRTIAQSALIVLATYGISCWPLIRDVRFAAWPESWHWIAMSCFGVATFLPFIWLALYGVLPVCVLVTLVSRNAHKYRRFIPACLVSWIILGCAIWFLFDSADITRKKALLRMTRQAKPVIAAIEAYRLQNGRYPRNLSDLTPKYIAKIPYTGAAGYPEFSYGIYSKGQPFKSYELAVDTPGMGINFAKFVYWPEKRYPDYIYGGVTKLFGSWAYVYE